MEEIARDPQSEHQGRFWKVTGSDLGELNGTAQCEVQGLVLLGCLEPF